MARALLKSAHRQDHKLILFLFYFAAFWPLLLNSGVYWDDWVLYGQAPGTILRLFSESGTVLAGYLDAPLASISPIYAKWFVFILYLLAMLALHQILLNTRLFDKNEAFFLTLFATIIPYNFARITTMCVHYAVCYLLFLLAFLALQAYMSKKKATLRLLSLALFFLSFGTESLMVFYAVVVAYVIYCERARLRSFKGGMKTLGRYADFVLVPIAFYAMKAIFLVPYGIYLNRNTIGIDRIEHSPYEYLLSLKASLLNVISGSVASAAATLVVSALLVLGTYWVLARVVGRPSSMQGERRVAARRFLLGALLFYLGVLPYLAIGRDGATFGLEWESRDQLLLGIGAAFLLYYALDYLSKRFRIGAWPQRIVMVLLVSAFIVTNASTYLRFQVDWFKQAAIIENVSADSVVKDNTTFIVDDRATALNAMERHVQFYEYNGMLKRAFGTDTRLAAWGSDIGAFANPSFLALCVERPQYNFKDYTYAAPTHTIVVDAGTRQVGFLSGARLLAEELFDPALFRADVKQVVTVRVEPIGQAVAPAQ